MPRPRPTPELLSVKKLLAMFAIVVALKAAVIGAYIWYVFSTKRVHDTIIDGDVARMNELLDRDPTWLNHRSHYGHTPIHEAARSGRVDALNELIRRGADVYALYHRGENGRDWNALHLAADKGHVEATAVLIRAGVDVDARTEHGVTPLDIARGRGHREVADLLRAASGAGEVVR